MVIAGITCQLVRNDSAVALALATGACWLGLHDGLLTDVDPADFLWAWTTNPNGNGQTFNLPPDVCGWNTNGAFLVGNAPFFNRSFLHQQTR